MAHLVPCFTMIYLLKIVIFQFAALNYQRVSWFDGWIAESEVKQVFVGFPHLRWSTLGYNKTTYS